ncbi:cache domain-containing sensor histidine kinase [Anaerotalea alkaliphila]|uniref:Sensor histidine kinase n=1 Tax=Anaerotalea alkaliphila TaxID=2662126 RepID=A0A7X5HY00_9FIRM|nr:sensor histidine kinase [Anaerotalea alkaliphila]NDL68700.1 sensor histidine kinase [Anaerotalea alkaliphila]
MKKPKMLGYLRVQIAAYYLLASLLLVTVLGSSLYYNVSSIVLQENLDATVTAVERSSDYIEVYVDRLKTVTAMIAENSQTIAYLSDEGADVSLRGTIDQLIDTALRTDPFLVSVILVSKDGRIVSNERALDMRMSDDMMKEVWYVNAVRSGGMPILTSARMQKFSMDKDQWVVSISREVTDGDGENIGVLVLDIRYQFIEDFLSELNLGHQGYAYIINADNQVVFHKDTSYFQEEAKRVALVEMMAMPQGYDKDRELLIHHTHLKNTDWTLVGVSSLDGLQGIRSQIQESLLFAGIVMLLVVAFSSVLIANRITNPIRRLEKAMAHIEGDLAHIAIEGQGCYEAKNLAIHFNDMMDRIKSLMEDVQEKEKNLRSYEINALHSQINPHFLYNTLDTIVWMAEFNEQEKVIAVTKSLAQFFRISLSQGDELIPLENEVEHTRQYLFIQKQRYMDKLSYSIRMEDWLGDVLVPKIILQPIVENAVYHGIRELDRPGHIEIRVLGMEGEIQLVVSDDGVGFDVARGTDKKPASPRKLGGVGIRNVDERIKLYYGEGFGVGIRSEKGKGTTAVLRIGYRTRKL